MKAKIMPLGGKYYGTTIEICDGELIGNHIDLWFASGKPSIRQIEAWGFTKEQWEDNVEIDDGWGGKVKIQDDLIADSHYECENTYNIALKIVNMLKLM